ncbi:MAG: hypothetical protein JWO47_677 [Candidatus Saccharibacteria bacterium]|nr:hypothetical protein [Candidatus Saccharibacteria bacterium]
MAERVTYTLETGGEVIFFDNIFGEHLGSEQASAQGQALRALLEDSYGAKPYIQIREPVFSAPDFITEQLERLHDNSHQGWAARTGTLGTAYDVLFMSKQVPAGESTKFQRTMFEPVEVLGGRVSEHKVAAAGVLYLALATSEVPSEEESLNLSDAEKRARRRVQIRVDDGAPGDRRWLEAIGFEFQGFRPHNSRGEEDKYGAQVFGAYSPIDVREKILSVYPEIGNLQQNI